MLKIRIILPVFVLLLFLGLSNAAFAQLSCSVASTPVSRATDTGLTEPAGDISFDCSQSSGTGSSATIITIDYGVPVTNNTVYPAGKSIAVSGNTCPNPFVASPIVVSAAGQLVIQVPAEAPGAGTTCSFTVTGVLLALTGSGKTSVSANVSVSPGNNLLITAGQNVATVITSVLSGLKAPTLTTGPGLVLTTGATVTPGSGAFTLSVAENYIDMYRAQAEFNSSFSTQGVQLLFTFTGIPTGVTLGGCSAGASGTGATATPFVVGGATTITSSSNTILVEIGAPANLASVEAVTLGCTTFTAGAAATIPLSAGNITAAVTLAPTGAALGSGGAVLTSATTGQIPRYTSNPLGPVTAISVVSASTHILFPFVSVGNGFDTGFVIANTTNDPYGGTANGGARALNGPVTLAFYPAGGGALAPFCVSTGPGAATVAGIASCTTITGSGSGQGLSPAGVVQSGSSWIVLASELFKQVTGAPSAFNGYVFGITNFPQAHASSFVADAAFTGKFTAGGPALVLANPAAIGRTFGLGLVESLGH